MISSIIVVSYIYVMFSQSVHSNYLFSTKKQKIAKSIRGENVFKYVNFLSIGEFKSKLNNIDDSRKNIFNILSISNPNSVC